VKKEIELSFLPKDAFNDEVIRNSIAQRLRINLNEISALNIIRRSIDARKREVVYRLLIEVYINEIPNQLEEKITYKHVDNGRRVIIVGSGPAGMFAALRLLELGFKPIVIERGKDVQTRRRDIRGIQQEHIVNPDSNYCFGEGGAGTYSDGKLYTRSTKRGNVKKILSVLVNHGAVKDILIDAHPHIGSNKLPQVVTSIRETILSHGGEVHFNSRVTDLLISENKISGVIVNESDEFTADAVILATGHSARDIYELLFNKGVRLESKPFALGVRIEHPQSLIDEIQYHSKEKDPNLPAASYGLTCQIDGRGVFSFCMCPGGIIVPASTAPGELVVNGMSLSKRNSPFANSGYVVTIDKEDITNYQSYGVFDGLQFQKEIEQKTFVAGGSSQTAPAQKVTDFMNNKLSNKLSRTSYIPGITSVPLHELLPDFIVKRLQKGLIEFNKKMRGYITEEAQLIAVESRTSSPLRIPRNPETYMHTEIEGLFPSGEGAGYAGGIVSAAIDGENCANGVNHYLSSLIKK
jgi:hypothetical protein